MGYPEKKYFYVLPVLLIFTLGSGAVAASGYTGTQSHGTLYTDLITGKSSSNVLVNDPLTISSAGSVAPLLKVADSGGSGVEAGIYVGLLAGPYMTSGGSVGTTTPNEFRIFTNNIDRITVSETGLVGINTVVPGATLFVNGSSTFRATAQGTQTFKFQNKTGFTIMDIDTANNRVGIGTTAPAERLTVKSAGIYWTDPHFALESALNTNKWDFIVGGDDSLYIGFNEATKFQMQVGGNLIVESGNVGIGTVAPIQKLDVAGTSRMTGFQMPTGAQNTYVLTSDAFGVGTWQAAPGALTWSLDQVLNVDYGSPLGMMLGKWSSEQRYGFIDIRDYASITPIDTVHIEVSSGPLTDRAALYIDQQRQGFGAYIVSDANDVAPWGAMKGALYAKNTNNGAVATFVSQGTEIPGDIGHQGSNIQPTVTIQNEWLDGYQISRVEALQVYGPTTITASRYAQASGVGGLLKLVPSNYMGDTPLLEIQGPTRTSIKAEGSIQAGTIQAGTVKVTGNVGIGTLTPLAKLVVANGITGEDGGSGDGIAVFVNSPNGAALNVSQGSISGLAGFFNGKVDVEGAITLNTVEKTAWQIKVCGINGGACLGQYLYTVVTSPNPPYNVAYYYNDASNNIASTGNIFQTTYYCPDGWGNPVDRSTGSVSWYDTLSCTGAEYTLNVPYGTGKACVQSSGIYETHFYKRYSGGCVSQSQTKTFHSVINAPNVIMPVYEFR